VQDKAKQPDLLPILTAGFLALAIFDGWFVRTLLQKNAFRKTDQIDGLTHESNRAHFTQCAQKAFNDKESVMGLALFDMDFVKKINDTCSHATGGLV
jgi:GGDEF domain-containing protein